MSTRSDDLKFLLSSEQGRRLWWQELEALGLHGLSTVNDAAGHSDERRTWFNEGRRSVAVDRFAEARVLAPDAFRLVLLENLAPPKPKEKPPNA